MFARTLTTLVALAALAFGPAAQAAGDLYTIDVVLPLTGGGAFVGATQQKSLVALESVVNKQNGIAGRPVHFVFHDDQTNPSVSLQLANDIIAKKPAVVFGSSLGALCKATIAQYASGPVSYCLSPVITPPPNGFVFSASVSGSDLILGTVRYFRGRGWTKFATLNTTDASGQIADADIAAALKLPENKGMTLIAAEHFNPGDTSVSAQVAKIKGLAPQALIVWSPGTPFGTALHGIQDVGLDVPVATTSANMIVGQMKTYAGYAPKNLYFQGVPYIAGVAREKDTAAYQTFSAAMKDSNIPQDFQSGMAWDPAMIVIDALRKIGPSATAEQLRAYLETLHGYSGIIGQYDFRGGNQRGVTVDDMLIMRWDPDKSDFVTVSKFGGLPL